MINSNDKKFNIWDKPTYLASQMPLQRNMALRYSYRETQAMISIQKKSHNSNASWISSTSVLCKGHDMKRKKSLLRTTPNNSHTPELP